MEKNTMHLELANACMQQLSGLRLLDLAEVEQVMATGVDSEANEVVSLCSPNLNAL